MSDRVLGAVKDLLKGTYKVGEEVLKSGRDSLVVAVPTTLLLGSYLASRLVSPGAVEKNLDDIVINANEKASLALAMRDLDRLRVRKKLKSAAKIHDQFV